MFTPVVKDQASKRHLNVFGAPVPSITTSKVCQRVSLLVPPLVRSFNPVPAKVALFTEPFATVVTWERVVPS